MQKNHFSENPKRPSAVTEAHEQKTWQDSSTEPMALPKT